MKKILSIFLLLAVSTLTTRAQILIQENFNVPYTLTGWSLQNLSDPTPPGQTWFAPTGSLTFNAFNGGPNDYIACNWASTSNSTSPQTISNWLLTPVVNLQNGAVLEFATRTTTNPTTFPDRLEVYMSTAGAGGNVGGTSSSVGTFSNLLVSINPGLSTTAYPGLWTVYSVTLTGLTGPTTGRFGFRYYVTNGGLGGANSDYIGLDAVQYSIPCNIIVPSYTICAGGSATLAAPGGALATTYTWLPGSSNNSSIVVTPGSTTSYTLAYTENGNVCPNATSTVSIGSNLSINIAASSNTVCSGGTVTLTAISVATTYSWSTGSITNSTTASPSVTTTYSVGGLSGFCVGGNTITINVIPNPTLITILNPAAICQGSSFTLTASGASSYIWLTSATSGSTNNPLVLIAVAAGPRTYTLAGFANGCASAGFVNFTVNPTPTVSVAASKTLVCTNNTVALTASGAISYSWTTGASPTANPLTYTAGAAAGTVSFAVQGTNAEGCSSTASLAITVSVCNTNPVGIMEAGNITETSIFPNPFSNEIRINALDGRVIVYNTLGQVLMTETSVGSVTLNTTELPKGAYVVQAYNSNGELVKSIRLVKN